MISCRYVAIRKRFGYKKPAYRVRFVGTEHLQNWNTIATRFVVEHKY
jgi:hypothetical protein